MTAISRAAAIGTVVAGRTLQYSYRGISFVLMTVSTSGSAVTMTVAASDARGPLPMDNPYIFVNPPLHVEDSAGPIVRTQTDPVTGAISERRLRLDPLAAIKETLYQTVILVAGRQGWTP